MTKTKWAVCIYRQLKDSSCRGCICSEQLLFTEQVLWTHLLRVGHTISQMKRHKSLDTPICKKEILINKISAKNIYWVVGRASLTRACKPRPGPGPGSGRGVARARVCFCGDPTKIYVLPPPQKWDAPWGSLYTTKVSIYIPNQTFAHRQCGKQVHHYLLFPCLTCSKVMFRRQFLIHSLMD